MKRKRRIVKDIGSDSESDKKRKVEISLTLNTVIHCSEVSRKITGARVHNLPQSGHGEITLLPSAAMVIQGISDVWVT